MSAWSLGPPEHETAWKCPDCDIVIPDEWPDEPGDEQCADIFEQVEQAPLVKPTGPCVVEIMPNGQHWKV